MPLHLHDLGKDKLPPVREHIDEYASKRPIIYFDTVVVVAVEEGVPIRHL